MHWIGASISRRAVSATGQFVALGRHADKNAVFSAASKASESARRIPRRRLACSFGKIHDDPIRGEQRARRSRIEHGATSFSTIRSPELALQDLSYETRRAPRRQRRRASARWHWTSMRAGRYERGYEDRDTRLRPLFHVQCRGPAVLRSLCGPDRPAYAGGAAVRRRRWLAWAAPCSRPAARRRRRPARATPGSPRRPHHIGGRLSASGRQTGRS